MKTVFDKDGKELKVGNHVIAPEPNESDIYNFGGWVGHITDILDNGNAIVEDADSDFFEIEANRLELVED